MRLLPTNFSILEILVQGLGTTQQTEWDTPATANIIHIDNIGAQLNKIILSREDD